MAAAVVAAKKADAFPTAQKFALVSTAVFAMQMLNVPIGAGVSGHVIGGVFAAAVLGVPAAVLSVALVLVIQTLLFADGGLDMLGLNVFNMAVVGAGFGGLLREFLISKNLSDTASTFSAAAISTMAAGFSLPSKTAFSANGSTARLRTSTTQYLSGDKFAPPPTPMAAQRIIRAEQKTNPYPPQHGAIFDDKILRRT